MWGEVLVVDVVEFFENVFFVFMVWIEMVEVLCEFGVGVFGLIYFLDMLIVVEKWIDWGGVFDVWFKCGVGECEGVVLGCVYCIDVFCVYFG